MFGKQYFKVDLFIDKNSLQSLYDYLCDWQNHETAANVAIQCVHTEKKVPCITIQVRGYDNVKDVINELLSYSDNFGYAVWLSKEDDFVAVSQCMLSIFEIGNVNVEVIAPNKQESDEQEEKNDDNESD